jgi:hypothetical protein
VSGLARFLPDYRQSVAVVEPDEPGLGHWTGAPSAVLADGVFWLAYRLRRPVDQGRGIAVVLARSSDGVRFSAVATVDRDAFSTASHERPALVARPDGGWRLFVSCSTPNSKHWWIEALDAEDVADLPTGKRSMILPGDERLAVKDPVVAAGPDGWRMWVCCHPLDIPGHEDRMSTRLATSPDGLDWTLGPEVATARRGGWDARGTRLAAVLPLGPQSFPVPGAPAGAQLLAWYDGRATMEENWFERTGLAVAGRDGVFAPLDLGPAGSPYPQHALRYVSVVPLPDGGHRLYYEASRPDGSHDLRSQLVPPAG